MKKIVIQFHLVFISMCLYLYAFYISRITLCLVLNSSCNNNIKMIFDGCIVILAVTLSQLIYNSLWIFCCTDCDLDGGGYCIMLSSAIKSIFGYEQFFHYPDYFTTLMFYGDYCAFLTTPAHTGEKLPKKVVHSNTDISECPCRCP